MTKPNRLSEAYLPRVMQIASPPVEPEIESLAKSVNIIGYLTSGCCKGHVDEERAPHPWVKVRPYQAPENPKLLNEIIERYNSSREIHWTFEKKILMPQACAITESGLSLLQTEATKLAEFIYAEVTEERYETYLVTIDSTL